MRTKVKIVASVLLQISNLALEHKMKESKLSMIGTNPWEGKEVRDTENTQRLFRSLILMW